MDTFFALLVDLGVLGRQGLLSIKHSCRGPQEIRGRQVGGGGVLKHGDT